MAAPRSKGSAGARRKEGVAVRTAYPTLHWGSSPMLPHGRTLLICLLARIPKA